MSDDDRIDAMREADRERQAARERAGGPAFGQSGPNEDGEQAAEGRRRVSALGRVEQFTAAREGLRIALEDAMVPTKAQDAEQSMMAHSLALIALNMDEMPFGGYDGALLVTVQP